MLSPIISVARQRLPGTLWQLPKRGFTAPIGKWIAGPNAAQFRDEVLQAGAGVANYLDMKQLAHRFARHQSGEAESSYALWSVWVLERWLERTRAHVATHAMIGK